MNKKLMLIINPAAGRSGYKVNIGEALKKLCDGGYITTLYFTQGPEDATKYAEQFAADYDVVACVGGDGTLSEVISGLMRIEGRPPLGYFPMGTANDVATTIGLPKNNMPGAAEKILTGTPHPFDVGKFGDDKYFSYIAAFGAFTDVSYATPQEQKKALGHLAYVLQAMSQLQQIESVHAKVEYDDGEVEGDFLYGSLSNSTSVAGMIKFTDEMVSLGDGKSELVLVKDPKTIEGFGEIVATVLAQEFKSDNLIILHTTKAKFTFDKEVAWTRDGEAGGEYKEVELSNVHCPVNLIF